MDASTPRRPAAEEQHQYYMTTLMAAFRLSAIWVDLATLVKMAVLSHQVRKCLSDPTLWRMPSLFAATEATFSAAQRAAAWTIVGLRPGTVLSRCFRRTPNRASVMWNPQLRAVASSCVFVSALRDFAEGVRVQATCGSGGEKLDFVRWWSSYSAQETLRQSATPGSVKNPRHTPLVPRILRRDAPSTVAAGLRPAFAPPPPFASPPPTGEELDALFRRTVDGELHDWRAAVDAIVSSLMRAKCSDYDWLVRCVAGVERMIYSTGGDIVASWPWIRAMVEVELRCCDGSPAFVRERVDAESEAEGGRVLHGAAGRESDDDDDDDDDDRVMVDATEKGAAAGRAGRGRAGAGVLYPFVAAEAMHSATEPLAPHAVGAVGAVGAAIYEERSKKVSASRLPLHYISCESFSQVDTCSPYTVPAESGAAAPRRTLERCGWTRRRDGRDGRDGRDRERRRRDGRGRGGRSGRRW